MSAASQNPELAIRAKPRPVRRFSRKAILFGSALLGIVMFAALAFALQSPTYDDGPSNELYNVTHKPMADGLDQLPKSYADYKPKLGPPLPGDLGAAYVAAKSLNEGALQKNVSLRQAGSKPYSVPSRSSYTAPETDPQNEIRAAGLFFSLSTERRDDNGGFAPQTSTNAYPNLADDYLAIAQTPFGYQTTALDTDPNKQESKLAFLESEAGDIYNSHSLQTPRSPYQVMAGTLISASLVTGLNSDLPGQVIGQVTENVYDSVSGEYLLIPQGARLMGRYDSVIAFGQRRALVVWTRLIFPNGNSIGLDNLPTTDGQGYAGLKDKVDKHTWQFIKGAALSSLLSIGSELASDDQGRLTRALQNAGQDTANIAGQRIIDRNLNVQPTLKVRPGWRFNVIVSRDLILKPYPEH
ncbi:MAG: conjugal transfer protein TraI [Robiginitomaculum sp.]|nr:MAG: conjugal transfer protein TraI [Robiginitomaculum sp.]